jgi:hypothetical protein
MVQPKDEITDMRTDDEMAYRVWDGLIKWTTASVQFWLGWLATENNVNGGSSWKRD